MQVNGVEIAVDTFGDPADPAILLIAGVGGSMDWWEPEFCEGLAAGGRYVIRYDHRDTGESVSYPPSEPGYTGEDLVTDAVGVLDALGVATAHVAGISAGAGIAQFVALDHPSRVSKLTLMSTSGGPGDADLPGMLSVDFPPEPDWSDRTAVIEYLVAGQRTVAAGPFDASEVRAVATIAVDRTANWESAEKNHHAAPSSSGPWRARLPEISVPTLVLHGDSDPMFPLPHGEALAREIPNARLVVLPATGHEFPRRNWAVVTKELLTL